MLSIVFLPWPTAVSTAFDPSAGTVLLSTGTLVVTSGSLTMLALRVHRHPALSVGRDRETRDEALGSATSLAALLIALFLGGVSLDRSTTSPCCCSSSADRWGTR